jgi:hypothetical protein
MSEEETKKNKEVSEKEVRNWFLSVLFVIFLILGGVGGCLYASPRYDVYKQEMGGLAELKKAEYNRRIAVFEANAKKESSTLLASAEVERAKGVAEANKIIGESLKENEAYLRWLWINGLAEGGNSVIYVPTEAGLPILEAGKR